MLRDALDGGLLMPPRTKLWPLDAHTRAKHAILRRYMQGWLPVITSRESKVVFIDGFAGPGEYEPEDGAGYGPEGSPIIALRALLDHAQFVSGAWADKRFIFMFIEQDKRRLAHLEEVALPRLGELPSNVKVFTECSDFASAMSQLLDNVTRLAPTLALIDPFGVDGMPLPLLHRLMEHPKSELLVTLMVEHMNRFKDTAEFADPMSELLGHAGWRRLIAPGRTPEERLDAISAAYRGRLADGGRSVVSWPMVKVDGHRIYDMVFATSDLQGMRKIKDAVWAVGGELGVSVSPRPKLTVEPVADVAALLVGRWAGSSVSKLDLITWILMETPYRETHLTQALRELEDRGIVDASPRSRRRSYPPGCTVTFSAGI